MNMSLQKIKSLRTEFKEWQGSEYSGTDDDLADLWFEMKKDYGKTPQTKKISSEMHEHFMANLQTDHLDRLSLKV